MATLADIDVLRHVPPFARLAERHLNAIADQCETVTLAPGASVTLGGTAPDALHVILRGRLRVVDERTAGAPVVIDELGRGTHAGESVFDGSTAPYSVYCVTEVEALRLAASKVPDLLDTWPDIDAALRARLDDRRNLAVAPSTDDDASSAEPPRPDAAPSGTPAAAPRPQAVAGRAALSALGRLGQYVRPLRRVLAEALLASVLLQVLALLLPVYARFVVDDVIGRRDESWLVPASIAMCGALVLGWFAGFARQYLLGFVSREVDAALSGEVHRHLLRLPLKFFESRHVGDTVAQFEATSRVTAFLTGTGVTFVIDMITAILTVVLMAYFDLRLTIVAVAFVAIEIGQLYFVTPRLTRASRVVTGLEQDRDTQLMEAFAGLPTIKVLALEHMTRWKLERRLTALVNATFDTLRQRAVAVMGSQTVGYLGPVAVMFYGAVLALRGDISVGVLVAFVLLSRALAAPFGTLVAAWSRLQDALTAIDAVGEVLAAAPESPADPGDAIALQRLQGHIRFDRVGFRYDDRGPEILRDVSFECFGGQRVAIVGPSGSGKTTLIKLLLGFYGPTAGAIHIDGFNLSDIWLPSFRRQAGVVLQDPKLFRGPIRTNIGQTMPAAPLSEVVGAARMANAHAFITRLASGYETLLEENGANLSGGQRQQVAIARALLHRPRMLVLDEATSNLDEESERAVQQSLDVHFRDCTVFTITQRIGSVRHADLVLVLDRGRIVEQGHPEQLLARRGVFYRMSVDQQQVRRSA